MGNVFSKIGIWLDDNGAQLASFIALFLAGFFSNLTQIASWYYWWVFAGIFFVVAVIFYIISFQTKKRVSKLESEIRKLEKNKEFLQENARDIVENFLHVISDRLPSFSKQDDIHNRISLYLFDSGFFIPCSRISSNPNFEEFKKSQYETGVGCIGKAWSDGWLFDNGFPDSGEDYVSYSRDRYSVDVDGLQIRMKSRLYCCLRIAHEKKKLGILAIESTKSERYELAVLEKEFKHNKTFGQFLGYLVAVLKPYIGLPSKFDEKGVLSE